MDSQYFQYVVSRVTKGIEISCQEAGSEDDRQRVMDRPGGGILHFVQIPLATTWSHDPSWMQTSLGHVPGWGFTSGNHSMCGRRHGWLVDSCLYHRPVVEETSNCLMASLSLAPWLSGQGAFRESFIQGASCPAPCLPSAGHLHLCYSHLGFCPSHWTVHSAGLGTCALTRCLGPFMVTSVHHSAPFGMAGYPATYPHSCLAQSHISPFYPHGNQNDLLKCIRPASHVALCPASL